MKHDAKTNTEKLEYFHTYFLIYLKFNDSVWHLDDLIKLIHRKKNTSNDILINREHLPTVIRCVDIIHLLNSKRMDSEMWLSMRFHHKLKGNFTDYIRINFSIYEQPFLKYNLSIEANTTAK